MTKLIEAADGLELSLKDCLDVLTKPDDRICCDGRECGCQGATLHQQSIYYANEALTAYRTARESADSTIDIRGALMDQIEKAVSESNWIPEEYHMNDAISDACSFLRGDARESAGEVKVKPLVWECEAGWRWKGTPPDGFFASVAKWVWSDMNGKFKYGGSKELFSTVEAAKAAAQSDYETKIRSALAE